MYAHTKDISHKNLNEHHFGRSNSTPIMAEDELDIDDLLSTSNYIFLEQHHSLETYNHQSYNRFISSRQPLSSIQVSHSNNQIWDTNSNFPANCHVSMVKQEHNNPLQLKQLSKGGPEEEKKGFISKDFKLIDYSGKENISFFSNSNMGDI